MGTTVIHRPETDLHQVKVRREAARSMQAAMQPEAAMRPEAERLPEAAMPPEAAMGREYWQAVRFHQDPGQGAAGMRDSDPDPCQYPVMVPVTETSHSDQPSGQDLRAKCWDPYHHAAASRQEPKVRSLPHHQAVWMLGCWEAPGRSDRQCWDAGSLCPKDRDHQAMCR